MKGTILITDKLFISETHEKLLTEAGYEFTRLDNPEASEAELIELVKGKVGYILGGNEKITENVINAADSLKAIAFTGSDWRAFVPGHELATKKGISISNTPGSNSYSVAEYVLTLTLAMMRNIFELGRTGDKKFQTTHSLKEMTVGILGLGHVGTIVATHMKALGAKRVIYYSTTRKPEIETIGIEYVSMEELLKESDIITPLVPKATGPGFIGEKELKMMKDGTMIINIGSRTLIDPDALYKELASGRLRSAQDGPIDERFNSLPLGTWFNSNASAAYNTIYANNTASDMAVKSIINMIEKGDDQYKVN